MRRITGRTDERGATLVFIGVMVAVIIGATGLAVDMGNLALQRSRAQHAADAAAWAIAYDCVSKDAARVTANCNEVYAESGTIPEFITKNASDGTGEVVSMDPNNHAKVRIEKPVDLFFLDVLGITSQTVGASAKTIWGWTNKGVTPPYAVGICDFLHQPIDPPYDVFLNGSTTENNGPVKDWKTGPTSGPADIPAAFWNPSSGSDTCSGGNPVPIGMPTPPPLARTIISGMWFSKSPYCNNSWSNGGSLLVMHDVICGTRVNTNQAYSGYEVQLDQVLLIPIYAPYDNWTNGGACVDAANHWVSCPGMTGASDAQFKLKVVGFAPFKISGWNLKGSSAGVETPDDQEGYMGKFVSSCPSCGEIDPSAPPGAHIGDPTVKLVE